MTYRRSKFTWAHYCGIASLRVGLLSFATRSFARRSRLGAGSVSMSKASIAILVALAPFTPVTPSTVN